MICKFKIRGKRIVAVISHGDDGHGARTGSQWTATADAFIGQADSSARYWLTSHHQITAIEAISLRR